VLALGFGLLVNWSVAASLVWTAWVAPTVQYGAWGIVVSVWFATACFSLLLQGVRQNKRGGRVVTLPESIAGCSENLPEDLFSPFHAQYLQGRWREAEELVRRMVAGDPLDADAVLMWATLCRHTRRVDEAENLLRRAEEIDEKGKWRLEISRERSALEALRRHGGPSTGLLDPAATARDR
jgi:hypothetical protein